MLGAKRRSIPANESKAVKFARLANARYKRAVVAIRGLGKLGGSGYERTGEQVTVLETKLMDEVKAMSLKLRPRAGSEPRAREQLPDAI